MLITEQVYYLHYGNIQQLLITASKVAIDTMPLTTVRVKYKFGLSWFIFEMRQKVYIQERNPFLRRWPVKAVKAVKAVTAFLHQF